MLLWDYNIVIEIEYKCKVEHVLNYEIHVNMWWWTVTLWDVKLWTWVYGCPQDIEGVVKDGTIFLVQATPQI